MIIPRSGMIMPTPTGYVSTARHPEPAALPDLIWVVFVSDRSSSVEARRRSSGIMRHSVRGRAAGSGAGGGPVHRSNTRCKSVTCYFIESDQAAG
jgi:hypothetical protein